MIISINDLGPVKKYVEVNSADIIRMNDEHDIGNAVDIALLMLADNDDV